MWPFPKRAKLPLTDSQINSLALGAVAEAIDFGGMHIEPMADGGSRISLSAENFVLPDRPAPFAHEPTTPAELSPEYHAGLALRMIDRLDADEHRLTNALDAEQRQHDALMASLHAELDGVRKVRAAYGKVGELLAEPDIKPGTVEKKPQRMTRGKRSADKPAIIVDHSAAE